jgi:hypothetical protein
MVESCGRRGCRAGRLRRIGQMAGLYHGHQEPSEVAFTAARVREAERLRQAGGSGAWRAQVEDAIIAIELRLATWEARSAEG